MRGFRSGQQSATVDRMDDSAAPALILPATLATESAAVEWLLGPCLGVPQPPRGESSRGQPREGLWEAWRGQRRVGAIWGESLPGASAVVWPPVVAAEEPASTVHELWQAALRSLQANRVLLAQVLLPSPDDPRRGAVESHGFRYLTDLLYLAAPREAFPGRDPAGCLSFEPYTPQNHDRLLDVIENTLISSLDCPGLAQGRSLEQMLDGYRGSGPFDPKLWQIARWQQQDVGCLLVNGPPREPDWELTYLGVVPKFRGRQFGRQLAARAQWLAHEADCRRLLLAVDAANRPALEMYAQTGFWSWDRRSVFVKSMEQSN